MLKVLLKKQMAEVFRSMYYNRKTNKPRSKRNVILMYLLFGFLIIGVIGGSFTAMAIGLSSGFAPAKMGWLYFAMMSGIAITAGVIGGVFSTYSGLYLPKDNDLLLSMPIPVRVIIVSRLVNVYLLGALYSAVVMLPTLIVWWVVDGITVMKVLCGIVLYLIVTMIVLILSCLLGWIVAKISLKLKNKSFVTVLISLLFIGGYYFIYFKAQGWIRDLVANAAVYGAKIKSGADFLYRFGRIGEGDAAAMGLFAAGTAAVLALTMLLLSRGFLKIATATGAVKKVQYKEKTVKEKSAFKAMLSKEFARFTSSPNYMLNCGLGVILMPALGVFLLIKGSDVLSALVPFFGNKAGCHILLLTAAMMLCATMNDMTAPSISLEGKSLWIPQTLPIEPKTILRAKIAMQLILTEIPMLFVAVCGAITVQATVVEKILICILPLVFVPFMTLLGLFFGVRNPILDWTSEIVPIKQSGAVMIALFGGWVLIAVFAAPYFFFGYQMGAALYLGIWAVVFAAGAIVLYRWLMTKGAVAFARL